MTALIYLAAGLVLLYFGAESLVKGAASLALRLGVSSLAIGLTVVAFGTSAPEMTVSIQTALSGQGDIAATNVVGSNIFNIAFILGLTALLSPIPVSRQLIRMDIPLMIAASVLGMAMLWDRRLDRVEGLILFSLIVVYTIWTLRQSQKKPPEPAGEVDEVKPVELGISIILVMIGLGLLVAGSKALVTGAIIIARQFGISEAVIGLTIVSAGTSLPELAASVVAAFRRQPDIAVGNIVGSNLFNILAILGASSLIKPYVAPGLNDGDLYMMLATAVISLPLMWTKHTLSRWEGLLLLAGYGGYLYWLWPKG